MTLTSAGWPEASFDIASGSRQLTAECLEGCIADAFDAPQPVDLAILRRVRIPGRGPLRVVGDERLGLRVVHGESMADRFLAVVLAEDQWFSGHVVLAFDLRRIELDMIGAPRRKVAAAAAH